MTYFSTLNVEVASSLETSIRFYETTRHIFPDDHTLHNYGQGKVIWSPGHSRIPVKLQILYKYI
jgi:hypothetical protein